MKDSYQLAVIGAGPAGMAAAQTAARHGVDVVLFDEQLRPGGQIYRNIENTAVAPELLGKDYAMGLQLVQSFRQSSLDYQPDTSVWYLDKSRQIGLLQQGFSEQISASRVVIATGAQERPMPFPGWQLPGVMTAGAGQVLLKSAAMVPEDGVVLAGSGPLLLLLVWQYLQAGVKIAALLETTPKSNKGKAIRYLPRAFAASEYLFKGWQLTRTIRRAGIPWYKSVSDLRAEGDTELKAVHFKSAGNSQRLETGLLLLHQGIIPDLQITQAAGCGLEWHEARQSWQPEHDQWGESSQSGIFVAGDLGGIVGAPAARLAGQIAGLQVAHQLGVLDKSERNRLAQSIQKARDRHLAIRPFLDAYYRIAEPALVPQDETLVCRCEEVTAGQIRDVIALGCSGPNQAKAFTRCGMGPCQGRLCAATVEQIFSSALNKPVSEIGRYNARPPLKPITLGQLAGLGRSDP
jgi:NADPH-dependent 2,4-dienoyl-CoA reductase/sulfur reductase-like enzyme